jgi:hypothetical protein
VPLKKVEKVAYGLAAAGGFRSEVIVPVNISKQCITRTACRLKGEIGNKCGLTAF